MSEATDRLDAADAAYLPILFGMRPVRVPYFPTSRDQRQSWTTARIARLESGEVFMEAGEPGRHLVLLSLAVPDHRWNELVPVTARVADAVSGEVRELTGLRSDSTVLVRTDRRYVVMGAPRTGRSPDLVSVTVNGVDPGAGEPEVVLAVAGNPPETPRRGSDLEFHPPLATDRPDEIARLTAVPGSPEEEAAWALEDDDV